MFCIQETRFRPNHIPTFKEYGCVFHNHDNSNNASGGVFICLKSNLKFNEINLNTNFQAFAIEIYFPIRFSIFNIYLPPDMQVN